MQRVVVNHSHAHLHTSLLRTTPAAHEGSGGKGDEGAKQNSSHFVGSWRHQQRLTNGWRALGTGRRRQDRGMDGKGHQLCLPAGPNTLGFFATEDLKVHPTRSPRPKGQPATQTNRNTQKKTIKKKKEDSLRLVTG